MASTNALSEIVNRLKSKVKTKSGKVRFKQCPSCDNLSFSKLGCKACGYKVKNAKSH